jgi:TP901 family phage tail tape measure protein
MADVSTLYIRVDSNGVVVASKNLKDLKKQAKTTTTQIDDVTTSSEKLNTAQSRTVGTLAKAASGFKTVGRDVQRYGLLLAGASAAITKFGFDLSSGLGQVQTLIPGTGDRIYELENTLKDLSITSGKTFNDLTEGLYQTISAFQDTADTEEIFRQATEASIAGASSTADAIELVSAVTKAYGDTTAEATSKVFDLAFETVRLGQTTFPQLANGIQIATDSAVRLGVSQEELFSSFSSLTGVIGDASEVATKFRSASASLLNPNEALLGLFSRLEDQTGQTIKNGKDFVEAAGGWQEALAYIVNTAEESDQPLQTYIRRIEGITLASRLATNSAEKYQKDLIEVTRNVGAASKSYEEVKEGIDEFRQSILESRQQIAVAASDIADNLIPRLADLLQSVADIITYVSQLDDSTQNLIITMGGFVIALGPILIGLGSMLRAVQLIQALNFAKTIGTFTAALGGPVGLIAVLAIVTAGVIATTIAINKSTEAIQKQKEALSGSNGIINDFQRVADKYDIITTASEANQFANLELIKQYPILEGKVNAYTDSLQDVYDKLVQLKGIEILDAYEKEINSVEKLAKTNAQSTAAQEANLARLEKAYKKIYGSDAEFDADSFLDSFYERSLNDTYFRDYFSTLVTDVQAGQTTLDYSWNEFIDKQNEIIDEINESTNLFTAVPDLDTGGIRLVAKEYEDIFKEAIDKGTDPPETTGAGDDKLKTWQEWFEEIAGVARSTFGDSGQKAGEEFRNKLQEALNVEVITSFLFGEDIDFVGTLEDQLDQTKDVFKELASLKAEAIANGEIFQVAGLNAEETDQVMQSLLKTITELTEQFNKASEVEIYQTLDEATASINAQALAFPELISEEERQEKILSSLKTAYDDLTKLGIDPTDESYKNLANTISAMEDDLEGQKKSVYGLKELWDDYKTTLRDLGLDAVADSFYEVGRALGDSSRSLEDFGDAMLDVLKGILDTLPALFIQAGLQAIVAGNIPLGLGLIAAGLAGNVVAGYVQGTIDEEQAKIDEKEEQAKIDAQQNNAHGAIYSFARGAALGSFENSIVNTPTLFNNGAGLMGEAGAEAILPLTRTSSGDLGVAAVGGNASPSVKVTIINNTGESVTQRETTNADGSRELEVTVGKLINRAISNGETDKAMRASYGIKRKGQN